MKFEIEIAPKVKKFLKKQSHEFLNKLYRKFIALSENPYRAEMLDIKKLKGYEDDYRVRVGKYRALYTIFAKEKVVYIYQIASRGASYK